MEGQQQYQCNNCGRMIPVSNKIIHDARCEKISQHIPQIQGVGNQQKPSFQANNNNIQQQNQSSLNDSRYSNKTLPKIVNCPDCKVKIPEKELQEHMKSSCEAQQIPCEYCSDLIPLSFFHMHEEQCSKNPHNLGTSVENIQIPCEICGRSIAGNVYESHVTECERNLQRQQEQQSSENQNDSRSSQQRMEDIRQTHIPYVNQNNNGYGSQPRDPFQFFQSFGGMQMGQPQMSMGMGMGMGMGQQQMTMGGFPQFPNQPYMQMGQQPPNQNQNQGGGIRVRVMTTLPNGSVILQDRNIDPSGSNGQQPVLGTNLMGPQNISYNPNPMGGGGNAQFSNLPNFLNMIFGSNFGTGGPLDLEQLMEMLNGSQGLDKETLESFTTVKYDKEKSKNLEPELKKCSICLEEFEDGEDVKFLLCLHRFHKACIDPWMEKHTTCPICKKDYSELSQGEM